MASNNQDWVTFVPRDVSEGDTRTPMEIRGPRSDAAFRNLFLKTGVSSEASGSSYVELGGTKLICSVHGPRAAASAKGLANKGALRVDVRVPSFAAPDKGGRSDTSRGGINPHTSRGMNERERSLASVVASSLSGSLRLESYPRTEIDLSVLVLDDNGGVLPASIIAGSLALADAGVEMNDLVAAASASHLGPGCGVVLDPSASEVDSARRVAGSSSSSELATVNVALMRHAEQVTLLESRGTFPTGGDLSRATALARGACAKVAGLMEECLAQACAREIARAAKRAGKGAAAGGGSGDGDGKRKKRKKRKGDE